MFFFFKQKTADEMRISDWSSDVCSSDLRPFREFGGDRPRIVTGEQHSARAVQFGRGIPDERRRRADEGDAAVDLLPFPETRGLERDLVRMIVDDTRHRLGDLGREIRVDPGERSEEHTSELQSLMRNS